MATTGLRPNEVAGCKQNDVHLNRHCIHVHVKGGWIKEAPISASMTAVLTDYMGIFDQRRKKVKFGKFRWQKAPDI